MLFDTRCVIVKTLFNVYSGANAYSERLLGRGTHKSCSFISLCTLQAQLLKIFSFDVIYASPNTRPQCCQDMRESASAPLWLCGSRTSAIACSRHSLLCLVTSVKADTHTPFPALTCIRNRFGLMLKCCSFCTRHKTHVTTPRVFFVQILTNHRAYA